MSIELNQGKFNVILARVTSTSCLIHLSAYTLV